MKKLLFKYILIIFILSSCASSHTTPTYSDLKFKRVADKDESSRKIIYESEIKLIVKNPDSTNSEIIKVAEKYKGYVVLSGNQYLQIRVQAPSMNKALEDISKLGKVRDKIISGKDVSEFYLDNEIRLENAEKARKRYLELLENAQTVSEGIMVEKELERLNVEIDALKVRLKQMDHLSEYATVDVRLQEKKILGPLGLLSMGVYKSVKLLFVIN